MILSSCIIPAAARAIPSVAPTDHPILPNCICMKYLLPSQSTKFCPMNQLSPVSTITSVCESIMDCTDDFKTRLVSGRCMSSELNVTG